jgi:hypothetical protein
MGKTVLYLMANQSFPDIGRDFAKWDRTAAKMKLATAVDFRGLLLQLQRSSFPQWRWLLGPHLCTH